MEKEQKLREIKNRMGHHYVLHPAYRPELNPAHRFRGSYYMAKVKRIAENAGRL